MTTLSSLMSLLAQAASQPAAGPNAPATPPTGGDPIWGMFVPLALMLAVFWFFMMRGQQKERKKQQEMLNAIKRADRVMTIGGVLGTVVDVRENEVVLKVDETNNVKMRFMRSAIRQVLTDGAPPADTGK